jgi:hypothetical protein
MFCGSAREGFLTPALSPISHPFISNFPLEFVPELQMMIAHNVFFSLFDNSPEAVQNLIGDCHRYLASLPGIVFFAAGSCSDVARSVNDRDYDVAAHIVFQDRTALDAYATAPKHLEFIEKHRPNWRNIRVFDSCVTPA